MARIVGFDWEVDDRFQVVATRSARIGGEDAGNRVDADAPIGTQGSVLAAGIDSDEEVYVLFDGEYKGRYVHFSLIAPAPAVPAEFQTPDDIEAFLEKEDPWQPKSSPGSTNPTNPAF